MAENQWGKTGGYLEDHPRTDGYVVFSTMLSNKSPKDRVVGPLPNGRFMAYKWGARS